MVLAGCAPIHVGPEISHDKLNQLVVGKTTKSEVIAMFGALPTGQSRSSIGTSTLTWTHTRKDYNPWIGIYLPAASDVVTVTFDKDDLVQSFNYGGYQGQRELSTGVGGPPDLNVKQ